MVNYRELRNKETTTPISSSLNGKHRKSMGSREDFFPLIRDSNSVFR